MWDDEAFRRRVADRESQLGRSLSRERRDWLSKNIQSGRRIDKIMEIARLLDWTLGQALGIEAQPPLETVNSDRLRKALNAAERVIASRVDYNDRTAAVADEATRIYKILSTREAAGYLTTEADLDLIVSSRKV